VSVIVAGVGDRGGAIRRVAGSAGQAVEDDRLR
jgi:hypothetical protein